MSVGGLVTAASHRAGSGVRAHVVSGEVWAARPSGSEARADRASGMRTAARHATKLVDATRQFSALRATYTSLTSASWIELGWKLAQALRRLGLSDWQGYKDVEAATGVVFYFATPHHSWERGTNENTKGLIRQYLPKRTSLAKITQADCDRIAEQLNSRPRKRLGYKTPEECYVQAW